MNNAEIIFNGSSINQTEDGISRYSSELYGKIKKTSKYKIIFFPKKNIRNKINISNLRKLPFAYQIKKKLENYNFKKFLKENKNIKLYHEPSFIFNDFDQKKIVTVHDLSWVHFPQFHPKERVKYLEKNFEKSLRNANAIISVSKFVKKDIINNFNIKPNLIHPIYLGCSTKFKKKLSRLKIDRFLKKKGIQFNNFFLVVSTIEPRKNLINTIKAFSNLKLRNLKPKLVIVGNLGWNFKKIKEKIDIANDVIHLQNISDEDLNILLLSQKACIFSSFFEGFGLPIIESMNFSKPIITSNNSSMAELAKRHSILIDPNDHERLTIYMKKIFEDRELYKKFSQKSQIRSKDFSWDKTASQTLNLYSKVLKSG